MRQGKYLGLNLPDYTDAADVQKLVENFEKLEERAPGWTNLSNSGTVLETGGSFQVAPLFPVGDAGIFAITLKMPRAFVEGDVVMVEDTAYNLYQGTDPALNDAWKAGEVVTINFDKTSRRCWASAGGGAPRPLPAQVSNMQASTPEGETPSIVFTWTNPSDENFAGMVLIVKEGSAPNSVTDGVQVYKGTGTTFTYTEGVQWEHTYFARGFAYNSQNKFQLDATGAIASATPSDVPNVVSEFRIVPKLGTATLTWKNPANNSYDKTVIVQKIGSIPSSISDGTEVYSGAETTVTVEKLQDKIAYFWRAFSVGKNNKYKKDAPSVTYTPRLVPDAYEFLACLTQNTEWTPPEDGFYRITCIGKSGDGATGYRGSYTSGPVRPTVTHSTMSGGYGGSGGAAGGMARSVLELRTSTSVHCTVTTSITSFGDYLSATAGVWNTPGAGTGGTDFVTTGNEGGQGGRGGRHEGETGTAGSKSYPARGNDGKGNGGQGGAARVSSSNFDINNVGGGGGGGGGTYALPSNISYDDPLYTTYIVRDLRSYRGGDGSDGRYVGSGSRYPEFSASNPIWYGGGNGGGGGSAGSYQSWDGFNPGYGSPGSPGGILIEKGVFH